MQANIRAEVNKGLNVAVEKKILLSLHRLIFRGKWLNSVNTISVY